LPTSGQRDPRRGVPAVSAAEGGSRRWTWAPPLVRRARLFNGPARRAPAAGGRPAIYFSHLPSLTVSGAEDRMSRRVPPIREDVLTIEASQPLRDRIESLRRELHRLHENNAAPEAILAVSRKLDALIIRLLKNDPAPDGDGDVSGR